MAQLSKFVPIGLFALSVFVGIIFFYFMGNLSKETRKLHIEQMISELINVILFIWLAKILINLSLFIEDPLAVLAYPSDSNAFYLAILFSTISLFIKNKRMKINGNALIKSFIPVFLITSFVYEFIHLVWIHENGSIGYFILITLLIILFYLLQEQVRMKKLLMILLVGWSVGVFALYLIQPMVTVFGYILAPWFVWLIFAVNMIIIFRKGDLT